jgi:5-methylcytosine-specific restriction enzyme A
MLPAVVFGLLFVLIFHLIKRQLSKPPDVKQEAVSQPMPQIRIQEIGPTVGSSRYYSLKSPYVRIPLTEKQRVFILNRDKCCQLCGRRPPEVILEVDHIFPVARGGTNDIGNLQALCRECNRAKGADLLT